MANVIAIGQPVNEAERRAIAHLRDHLPEGYLVLHNFEVEREGERFEVDIAVLAPHAVYLVDVKGTRGPIHVAGPKWYPEGRQPFTSPLLKLRGHARTLKGLITASDPARRELGGIYVDAAIVLTEPDAQLIDPTGRDEPAVTTLAKAGSFFRDAGRIPSQFSTNIAKLHATVIKALQGVARPRTEPMRFGSWEVVEKLGATDAYVEYRAVNVFAGARAGTVLLRAYQADPYLPDAERARQRTRIANAYQALNRMPGHPAIAGARDFFATESEDRFILVTEDVSGQALKLHVERPNLALTLDQKLQVAKDLLAALEHSHGHQVVHRNLTPSTILVTTDGRARLVGFDFARAGADRSRTIADEIVEELDPAYLAPEVQGELAAASPASDVFSAGLVLYELFSGEKPFSSPTEVFDQAGVFPVRPSSHRSELTPEVDAWLQRLCIFDPEHRPTASTALRELMALPLAGEPRSDKYEERSASSTAGTDSGAARQIEYRALPSGHQLTSKYVVQRRLGQPGSFGVVYKVIDTLGDVTRAVKLILRDRHSTLDRLKNEYRTLLRVPEHPNVVRVIDADMIPGGGPPFIVFEFVDGLDVGEMIEQRLFTPEDALQLGRQVADGLTHLHLHEVYHCDIKPRNLLWAPQGVRIIDFNVAVMEAAGVTHGGGSRRYIPPDLDLAAPPHGSDLADRDVYALGITIYEALSGAYPWQTSTPPAGQAPRDLRELSGLADLSPEFAEVVLRALAPRRADRFGSAKELRTALIEIRQARRRAPATTEVGVAWAAMGLGEDGALPPNTNPFVGHMLTLYSQSPLTNAGTRGLDAFGEQTYVETALDRELVPAVLAGELKLVVITGNAGDGKTALLQRLERQAERQGATLDKSPVNGCAFSLNGRQYLSNYDGSQDEGDRPNDVVLSEFLAPFKGADSSSWPGDLVRLVAINEGRLVDFLEHEAARFPALGALVRDGLARGVPAQGVAVVNLNLRSVVVDPEGMDGSILERLMRRFTHEKFWEPCLACDLRGKCYALHNAQTFRDPVAGPRVLERLKALFTLTHLQGRLHMTLRDLRSALAFMLVGTSDCRGIHKLYSSGARDEIIKRFYFNSWMGGDRPNEDRLLRALKEVDIGHTADPRLDRALDFVSPAEDRQLFQLHDRGNYDREILQRLFQDLPREVTGETGRHRAEAHRKFVAMMRRRSFFERRDDRWHTLLPYRSAERLLSLVRGEVEPGRVLPELLSAINRGEGLIEPNRLGGGLALQVRHVERGTIRSYRVFPAERFSIGLLDDGAEARFVEKMPAGLRLKYRSETGTEAELPVDLEVFEMLNRLNHGYRPSLEEEQGYYLSLTVFKNVLASEPYQEVLLTTTGHEFFGVQRHTDGRLEMQRLGVEVR